MSVYKKIAKIGSKLFSEHKLFKYGFNYSPMYKRSTAKIIEVSPNLLHIRIKLPISYKNRNYVSSIFGGSMFSAVDPIPMVQLMNLIGDDYVVWDKSAQIFFKRPAKENLYADFDYSEKELKDIKNQVSEKKEIEIVKTTQLTNKNRSVIYCEVKKTIYVADKKFYKQKRKNK
ncbi:DUF4442 domain-containing protein [Maribacter thermophilus]|uniref:DUF4442 domain-containing protein n=1 Tax=Maribacter thermophilus TaxID=1197874 RepID=UPI0006414B33|nr:DUF4442 domain-containing protein [Maribacter thermophilus]